MAPKGIIISGKFGELLVRQKSGNPIEIGELLVADGVLLQVYDLGFGSQISQTNLELISGMRLEEETDFAFMDPKLRNYNLAYAKGILMLEGKTARSSKSLPNFFSEVREVTKADLGFLTKPKSPLYLGKLRSGSRTVDVDIYLEGDKTFSHHVLIAATTGRGKSNLASTILWDAIERDYCGILVLDPHDEYYGRGRLGLKDHPNRSKLLYYTSNNPPPGTITLKINIDVLRPGHFNGVTEFSEAQKEAINSYHKRYGAGWIEAIVLGKPLDYDYHEGTLAVVRRRVMSLLDLEFSDDRLHCRGIFDINSGATTISDISDALEAGKTVIIDTSNMPSSTEILVGSLVTSEIFRRYQKYKRQGTLGSKPVVSIFLEEAPRVIGKEVLQSGPNIFSTIAREGRKFKVGLTAITQLPSLIPRDILANINTKIILGIEMAQEREAIISSASQDLSEDTRNIASLDRGEAIITSNFTRFAIPVKIPLFEEFAGRSDSRKAIGYAELKT